eukprot:4126718-Amphidinium_carterae.1
MESDVCQSRRWSSLQEATGEYMTEYTAWARCNMDLPWAMSLFQVGVAFWPRVQKPRQQRTVASVHPMGGLHDHAIGAVLTDAVDEANDSGMEDMLWASDEGEGDDDIDDDADNEDGPADLERLMALAEATGTEEQEDLITEQHDPLAAHEIIDVNEHLWPSEPDADHNPLVPPVPLPEPPPEEANVHEPMPRMFLGRAVASAEVRLNRGVIRYHDSKQAFEATCNQHAGRCVLTRTSKPGRGGAGRPIAFLSCWLDMDASSKQEHTNKANWTFSHEQRLAARANIALMIGGPELLGYERDPHPGEGEEPTSLVGLIK